jgi:two-component sensor histidine kinase
MRFLPTILFILISLGYAQQVDAQSKAIPHLTPEMISKEGILTLPFKEVWKYHPNDDLRWADPNFDDAHWHTVYPDGLRANDMPDSIWQGYGWWRLAFTADTALYKHISRLYFRGWGAAEVYLDGVKTHTYGNFSTEPALEKSNIPRYAIDKPIKMPSQAVHVLAIRFSNHQAKKNQAILKHNATPLGFSIGFANEKKGTDSERNYAYAIASLSVVTAILLLLLLLHLILYFKFPKDTSNLFISLVITFFLISSMTNYVHLFIEFNGFLFSIFRGFINSTAFGLGLVLLPYTLALIFRLTQYTWSKHLMWIAVARAIFYFFPILPIIVYDAVFIVIILLSIGFMMYHAIRSKQQGVHYITAGAIGTTVFLLIDRLYATNIINLSTPNFYIVFVFVFLCFPIGLSVYITARYGTLFFSMEQEVSLRTFELNQSLDNLKAAQTSLSARNAENELLLKEIHHRVKNNLEVVSSLLALQSAQIDDPSVQDAMQASQNRVNSMGILHQKLYQGEHLAFIEMKNYFINLSENILDSYNATDRVTIDCTMNEINLDIDTAVPIGLIVNELLTNSLKYAFTKGQMGTVKLSLEDKGQNILQLKIADNGIGKSLIHKPQGTGFGTQLVDLLTKQLDGTIHQEINNGTIISIDFKRAKAA